MSKPKDYEKQLELRKLDHRVALNVLGRSDAELGLCGDLPEVIVPGLGIFHPTEDWAMAGQVLEKCGQKLSDEQAELDCLMIQFYDGQWHICRYIECDMETASAPTLPLAVCMAAQKIFLAK